MIEKHGMRIGLALAAAALASLPAYAAGTFASEVGTDVAAATSKVKLSMMNGDKDGDDSGRGPRPYLQALGGPPKRVALVSFYVWDCGNKKENHYNPVWHYKRTNNVEAAAVDVFANELYEASIAGMKEEFAAHGTQLLTADEFLDTEAKRKIYDDYDMQAGGFQKFFVKHQQTTADKWRFTGAPEGYRVLQVATINDVKGNHFDLGATGIGVGKLAKTLGYDLANALGVDAVAILYNVIQAESKSITMRGAYMYMFGPNPVPDSGQSLYWNGHQYSGDYLRMDVPFIITDKDGKLVSSDYKGYEVVGRALARRMGEHLQERSGKAGG